MDIPPEDQMQPPAPKRSARRWLAGVAAVLLGAIIVGVLRITAVQLGQNRSAATTSTPLVSTAPTPPSALADISMMRPYDPSSAWNTPINSAARADANSDAMIATIGMSKNGGAISSDASQFSYPVYFADRSTPRWDLQCSKYDCTIVTSKDTEVTSTIKGVPIPDNAKPSTGTDGNLIVIDRVTGAEYNLWQARRTETGWKISNASVYNIFWDAMPERYGSRGAGIPYYAGLVRPWEIAQGHIDHAIAFGYPFPARGRCVFPASKTDGTSDLADAIPEGARLQLNPQLTEADFDRLGLDRTGKIIARALQEYGMILVDYSGRPKIYIENLADNPFATQAWSDPQLSLTAWTIGQIPYSSFRVLALPAAYWNPSRTGPTHGDCAAP
jgi:hypothetical protein